MSQREIIKGSLLDQILNAGEIHEKEFDVVTNYSAFRFTKWSSTVSETLKEVGVEHYAFSRTDSQRFPSEGSKFDDIIVDKYQVNPAYGRPPLKMILTFKKINPQKPKLVTLKKVVIRAWYD